MDISLAARSGRRAMSGGMKSTSVRPRSTAQSRKPVPRFCMRCATLPAQLVTAQKSLMRTETPNPSRTPAITACITTKDLSQWPRRTGWKWSTTPNTVGQLPAPELTCWISSSNRAGRTCRWSRVFPCWMCSERSTRAGAEPKSPVAPANTFAPNVAIAAEQRRQST